MRIGLHRPIAACAAAIACVAPAPWARAQPAAVQAELFQSQHAGARSDGVRAAGRLPWLGIVQLDYTRVQREAPERASSTAVEWRPGSQVLPGFSVRATERRDGDVRTRTLEVGWQVRF